MDRVAPGTTATLISPAYQWGDGLDIPTQVWGRVALTRTLIDSSLELTTEEFRVENDLIIVGPLFGDATNRLISLLEDAGLHYFDDYFELTGNWPEWLTLYAKHST